MMEVRRQGGGPHNKSRISRSIFYIQDCVGEVIGFDDPAIGTAALAPASHGRSHGVGLAGLLFV